jgi:fructokinase
VSVDDAGQASYHFSVEGTADWQWTAAELGALPAATEVLHFGSLASWTSPGGERIDQLVVGVRAAGDVLVSYDPNVRPLVIGPHAKALERIERGVRHAHVVKASRDDAEWLYPGTGLDEVGARWLGLGPKLVVLTDGSAGATAYRAGAAPLRCPSRPVQVVDTIGAGDAFTAGMLSALAARGLQAPGAAISDDVLADVLDKALLVAAITCERAGADPPRVEDLPRT